jgi:hypothetical protein
VTVLTLSELGAVSIDATDQLLLARVPATALAGSLGNGDAFAASYL